ncbi:MAG: GNAT family N-acetyltransferase [Actinomycetota bacterium]|nr:GNAT family N-acetyltransferase [Actinomycetota bacterium]
MRECDVRWATDSAWSDIEQLFGRGGASNGCWCQYWLLGPDFHRRERSRNRRDLTAQVRSGSAGLLAYRDDAAVGWARFTPRSELAFLTARFASYDFGYGDPWSLSCFFVARRARGQGVMRALIDFAAQWGHDQHTQVEAYPIDPAIAGATGNRFPGLLPTFLAAGFVEDGRLAKDRAVVKSVTR